MPWDFVANEEFITMDYSVTGDVRGTLVATNDIVIPPGAEESGLVGSQFYVDSLTKKQIQNTAVNLNFDMVGSPNYVRFVYDGDASDTDSLGSTGSGVVEDVFTDYFDSQGLASEPTAFDGRSDYDAFINVGIPAGGLFTGAEGIKTVEEEEDYGGVAGVAYDPCYHQACDSLTPLADGADPAAYAAIEAGYPPARSSATSTPRLWTRCRTRSPTAR